MFAGMSVNDPYQVGQQIALAQEASYRDVTEILAIPIGAVRSSVNRVPALLRSRLKQGFAGYAT